MQSSLKSDLVPIGSTTLVFGMSVSCAVFLAVGQAIFQSRLLQNLEMAFSEQDAHAIISAGASQAQYFGSSSNHAVANAYSNAIADVFVNITGLTFPVARLTTSSIYQWQVRYCHSYSCAEHNGPASKSRGSEQVFELSAGLLVSLGGE